MDLHNQKRMHIANGLEERGDPGPQPSAANMMELVSFNFMKLLFESTLILFEMQHIHESITST